MIALDPIGYVRAERNEIRDDWWGDAVSIIELVKPYGPDSLLGLDQFSHAEIIFVFDRLEPAELVRGASRPRGNPDWPLVGVFAQRTKHRPNRLGATMVEIISVSGSVLTVGGLDALDGTPVVDIKPVMAEFLPRGPVRQPDWSHQLMTDYWRRQE